MQQTALSLGSQCITDGEIDPIVKTFADNPTITALDFNNNEIGVSGARCIANALALPGSNVADIDLRANRIGDQGVHHIAKALENSKVIKTLDFRRNQIGTQGAGYIADLLAATYTIENIDLRHNNIGSEGIDMIAEALENTGNATHVNLTDGNSLFCKEKRSHLARLSAVMEKNKNAPFVLTMRWAPPEGNDLSITCSTIAGEDVATQLIRLSDTVAELKAMLRSSLHISAHRLTLTLPDGALLDNSLGTLAIGHVLGLTSDL